MIRILTLLSALLFAGNGWAQDSSPLRLETGEAGKGWGAVGRLEIDERSFCTGSLIAPDLVLTAAHCLFERGSGVPIAVDRIEFRAGWRNGRAEAYRTVRQAAIHPGYDPVAKAGPRRVVNDLALLKLHHPIRNTTIKPFEVAGHLRKGSKIGVVSYAVGREEAPSFQEMCRVLGRQQGVYVMSCNIDFGSSGAPVFDLGGDEPRIASVVSAKAQMQGEKVSLGMGLDEALDVLRTELEGGKVGKIRQVSPQQDRNRTGAKFVSAGKG